MKKDKLLLFAGVLIFLVALFLPEGLNVVRFLLFLAAFLLSGAEVIKNALKGILRGDIFNENTLMVVAAIGAFCIREYPEAVFVVVFYRIGELFEHYAVTRSRKSISEVMNICPEYANLLVEGKTEQVDPEEVSIGDTILVGPGERVPLDGVVLAGESFVDTSALTGESVPRQVKEGDEILSGCINQNALLTIRVTKVFEDSTVSRILELVETAAARKSSSEKFITKFARYYTPIVLLCALLLAVLPPLLLEGASFRDYLYRALSFLVVSCPCALVISVPLAFFGGIGGAAKQGILIKGGTYLEVLSKADTVVFDKTGTLTKGVFKVQRVDPVGVSEQDLLDLAACAEALSTHPVAKAIRDKLESPVDMGRIAESEEIPGCGVKAAVDGKVVYAGNSRLMKQLGVEYPPVEGGTAVYVACDGTYLGSILIADEIKPDAKDAIAGLKKAGIKRTLMLSGDVRKTAEQTAKALGLDDFRSDLLPGDKVSELEKIMTEAGGKTVYVGDGINDAPVLSRADAGIAMGALGSDAAIEASDVVIMTDEVGKIRTAVAIAKKTMTIATENIVFSVAIKLGILLLCSLNIVGMGVAVFGDVGVMVLAVLNSFRALREPKNHFI